jgi:hypothetical protein
MYKKANFWGAKLYLLSKAQPYNELITPPQMEMNENI